MMASVCEAIAKRPVAHLVYISSDAVYADGPLPLDRSLAGRADEPARRDASRARADAAQRRWRDAARHAAADAASTAPAIRTMATGPTASAARPIAAKPSSCSARARSAAITSTSTTLPRSSRLVLDHRSAGVLNVATGTVASFRAMAEKAVALGGAAGRDQEPAAQRADAAQRLSPVRSGGDARGVSGLPLHRRSMPAWRGRSGEEFG